MNTATMVLRPVDFPAEVERVVELLTAINAHDQPGWFPSVPGLTNDWSPTSTFDPARDLQGLEIDGVLVGLTRHSWRERPAVVNHRLEVYVHPEQRRRGFGSRLLAWAEDRARASVAAGDGGPRTKPQQFGGAGSDRGGMVEPFALGHGFTPYRYHFDMRRSLADPIEDAPLPAGIDVRPVLPEHHRAIFAADEEAFADHWDHAAPVESDYARFFGDPDLDTSLWQVGWDGDEVAGSIINSIIPHENAATGQQVGWLDSVATRRPWRGRGLAAALIARSLRVLRERGMEIAALGVDAENPTGALQLYQRAGFKPVSRWTFYRKPFEVPEQA
jgi:mycothiol synthase